ncbi:hypothetical protein BK129_14705 [Paenibacillus amylolyticus]|uniref:hypothetical protein n=1 Tax=Paenibacillus amylolyticus TaxID=1451 RepID=UPI00096CCE73|nr:hypothetical protein [Paenibacillus amylolyticus]OMF05235.1 hypothetical protein BK129_14705 [Paenibacillus amylolyticus]
MSERVYKLLDGSELLVSGEVIGVRLKPESMPLTTDGDGVIDDVLDLLDKTVYERDRLRKALTDALKLMDKKFYGMAHKNIVEALGQEGEGNQCK